MSKFIQRSTSYTVETHFCSLYQTCLSCSLKTRTHMDWLFTVCVPEQLFSWRCLDSEIILTVNMHFRHSSDSPSVDCLMKADIRSDWSRQVGWSPLVPKVFLWVFVSETLQWELRMELRSVSISFEMCFNSTVAGRAALFSIIYYCSRV